MCEQKKSNEKAALLRNAGNILYKERKFHDAIVHYNKSLCFSEGENLGLAFANRSAVCFELKLFKKCLANISMARLHNYPKENFEILKIREKKCFEYINRARPPVREKFFKLSHKSHDKISYVSKLLEMKMNEKFGRHIVAREDLHVGDIVAEERAFCSVLLTQSKFHDIDENNCYSRCSYCLKSNEFELIPCENCCSVMFCKDCQSEAEERFHKYECPIVDQLVASGSVHIALRIFFTALSVFDGSIDDLRSFIDEIDKDNSFTIFDFSVKPKLKFNRENVKNFLRAMNSLARSDSTFPLNQHEIILENHPDLSQMWSENKQFIRLFLQRQCQLNDHYFHGIFGVNLNKPNSKAIKDMQQSIGSGWFPFCSLINHSCCSNVMRFYIDGKVVLVVSRLIQKGDQLFDCYKTSFLQISREERQRKLQREFGFVCDCEACRGNFPIMSKMPVKNINLAKLAKSMEDELLGSENIGRSTKNYRVCCRLIEENRENFPSVELALLQKCFALYLLLQAKSDSLN